MSKYGYNEHYENNNFSSNFLIELYIQVQNWKIILYAACDYIKEVKTLLNEEIKNNNDDILLIKQKLKNAKERKVMIKANYRFMKNKFHELLKSIPKYLD